MPCRRQSRPKLPEVMPNACAASALLLYIRAARSTRSLVIPLSIGLPPILLSECASEHLTDRVVVMLLGFVDALCAVFVQGGLDRGMTKLVLEGLQGPVRRLLVEPGKGMPQQVGVDVL